MPTRRDDHNAQFTITPDWRMLLFTTLLVATAAVQTGSLPCAHFCVHSRRVIRLLMEEKVTREVETLVDDVVFVDGYSDTFF